MTTPGKGAPRTDSGPRTIREHLLARYTAERRRATAQRKVNHLQRGVRRDLRGLRRTGKTTAIIARSRLAELGVLSLTALLDGLRPGHERRDGMPDDR